MSKPKFDATAAEGYLMNLCVHYTDVKNQIFKRDNEGRDSVNFVYSADYQNWLGKEIAIREVLEYFKKFEI